MVGLKAQSALKTTGRVVEPALFLESEAEVIVILGIMGCNTQCLAIAGLRFLQASGMHQYVAQVVPRFGMVGIEVQGAPVKLLGAVALPLIEEENAEIVQGIGKAGLVIDGRAITNGRFVQPAQVPECVTKIVMRPGIAGLMPQRLAKGLFGLIVLALPGQHSAQIGERMHVLRVQAQGGLETGVGLAKHALLGERGSQIDMQVGDEGL